MSKRYYWLKFDKDFFNRPGIKIIESQADGVLYSYFYLKLLLQSVESQGVLKYNNIPFDVEMLSKITGTSPSVVKSAIDIFLKMNMLQILEDGSLFISEVALLLGSETEDARRKREKKKEINLIENKEIKEEKKRAMTVAERVKKYREKKKLENNVTKCNVTCNENSNEDVTKISLKSIENKEKKCNGKFPENFLISRYR